MTQFEDCAAFLSAIYARFDMDDLISISEIDPIHVLTSLVGVWYCRNTMRLYRLELTDLHRLMTALCMAQVPRSGLKRVRKLVRRKLVSTNVLKMCEKYGLERIPLKA